MIKKVRKISFTVDPNEIALNRRKFDTSEIGRGIGVHKVKKGKGGYNRNGKHKMNYGRDDYGSFYFCAAN